MFSGSSLFEKNLTVADIMTKEVISTTAETPLMEAADILARLRIHGLPVVNKEFKLIGVITESDFFSKDSSNVFLPTLLGFMDNDKAHVSQSGNSFGLEHLSKVADIMTVNCETVGADMSINELIGLFKEENYNFYPVVNSYGVLVGVVTIMDVIRLL